MKKIVTIGYVAFAAPLGSVAGPTNLTFIDANGVRVTSAIAAGQTTSDPVDLGIGDWICVAQTVDANTGATLGASVETAFSVTGAPTTVTVNVAGSLAVADAPAS